ncbi:MAG TPA: DUF692 family protein [Kofleriaceae bacterium]|nr:DUF692 family protein [Kofleriaceae bacterium]
MPAAPQLLNARAHQRGIGLRAAHILEVIAAPPAETWFEVISENFFGGGAALERLQAVGSQHALSLHGVAMYLGSPEPLNPRYLKDLKALIRAVNPVQVTDHLCWGSVDGKYSHDLLPLPMTRAIARYVAEKIRIAQDVLEVPIAVENVSSYAAFAATEMNEWDFVMEVANLADCRLLVDVNNIVVSAHNHGFDAQRYIDAIDPQRVAEIHLAGYIETELAGQRFRLDTHSASVTDDTWALYKYATQRFGAVPTLLERDADIPALADLLTEADHARNVQRGATSQPPHAQVLTPAQRSEPAVPAQLANTTNAVFAALRLPLAGAARELAELPSRVAFEAGAAAVDATALLVDTPRLHRTNSLETYHRQYWYRLIDAVAEDFPVLQFILGAPALRSLVEAYLDHVPIHDYCLATLGSAFADFVADRAQLVPALQLGEVARIEWAMLQARNCAATTSLAHELAAGVAGPGPWRMREGTTLLTLQSNALAVYRAAQREQPRPLEIRTTLDHAVTVVVAGGPQGVTARAAGIREATLLRELLNSASLDEFAEQIAKRGSPTVAAPTAAAFETFVSRCFAKWTTNNWLTVSAT